MLIPRVLTSMEHPGDVERALESVDALIIGAYAYPELLGRLSPGKPAVQLAYLPGEGTLHRPRALVAADVGAG
jgi:hypothetical protein